MQTPHHFFEVRDGLTLQPLDEKVKRVWVINTFIGAFFSTAIFAAIEFLVLRREVAWWREPALTIGWVVFTLTYGLSMIKRRFKSWRYGMDEYALTVEHGVWTRTRLSIPRARIQHVEIHEGPWDRRFGIKQLNVHTAGTASIQIPGLPPEEAERLRSELIFTAATAETLPFDADASDLLHP